MSPLKDKDVLWNARASTWTSLCIWETLLGDHGLPVTGDQVD